MYQGLVFGFAGYGNRERYLYTAVTFFCIGAKKSKLLRDFMLM